MDCVVDVLRLFNGQGLLRIECRTVTGIGHQSHVLQSIGAQTNAGFLEDLLSEGWTLNVMPARDHGGVFAELPIAFALWRPATEFSSSARRRVVTLDGQARVASGLATMPLPSVLIDAGPEVWAGWRLERAMSDQSEAESLLATLAGRLCAEPVDDLRACSLPLAGSIRNWNVTPPEPITVLKLDSALRLSVSDLLKVANV